MKKFALPLILFSFFIASCVPTQRFKEVSDKGNKLEEERDQLMAENEKLTVENTEMKANISKVMDEQARFVKDSTAQAAAIEKARLENEKLSRSYDDLTASYDALLQGNARETTRLLTQLQAAQEDLQKKEDRLRDLDATVGSERQNITRLRAELEARNARLTELENILNRKDSVVNALKESVSKALMGFEGQGLTVQMKNGKVYVSLDEKLLFKSGSTSVDPKGVQALQKLSKVLESNRDVNIMIEGHTDDVPFTKGASIKDNWDLSVMRATAVVRILLDGSSIDPVRLTAAGHGEFMPVDPAKTTEARTKNRRTEIILTPKLDELLKILETN
ncbi:MAG: OmpA family protein [Bacteroidales bacterium]|nr:OmpA family protein [Bacteroidales bacterium]MCB8999818.1 OmpA family protein [Bacteroidales bacterium]